MGPVHVLDKRSAEHLCTPKSLAFGFVGRPGLPLCTVCCFTHWVHGCAGVCSVLVSFCGHLVLRIFPGTPREGGRQVEPGVRCGEPVQGDHLTQDSHPLPPSQMGSSETGSFLNRLGTFKENPRTGSWVQHYGIMGKGAGCSANFPYR